MITHACRLIARYSHVNWALADQGMVSAVNFATGIMLARFLGIEEFGRFTLAWMAVLFVNSIQYAAIISPMMSIGPKQAAGDEPAYYGAVAAQQLAFAAAAFAIVLGGATAAAGIFPDWNIEGLALPLACAALALQAQDFLRRYFFTRGRGGAAFVTDAVRYGGQLAILFWLFQTTSMDSAATLWVIAALAAIGALAALPACERMEWRPTTVRITTARHWHFSKWLAGSALMQWTSGNLFILAAGAILGAWAVGALKAAQNLMGVPHILFQGLENVVPVRAAWHLQIGGPQGLKTYLLRVTIYGELATGAVAAVMFVAPEFWLELVFGEEYQGFGFLLRWYAAIYVLVFLSLPLRAGLRAVENTRTIFWAYLWMTLFSLVSAYPVTEFWGLIGVLLGLFIVQVISLIVFWSDFRKRIATRAA